MKYTKKKIKLGHLPSLTDIEEYKTAEFLKGVQQTILSGKLEKYKSAVINMEDSEISSTDIAAALLKMALGTIAEDDSIDDEEIDEISYANDTNERFVKASLTIGKSKGIRIKDVVGAIAGECGIPGREIGDIEVFEDFTLVDIPKRYFKDVLKGMKNKKIRGNKVIISRSKL
jgi:ATP-dependent RNA helicase DeaD